MNNEMLIRITRYYRSLNKLRAIGLEKELLDSTLRFSMSVFTTQEEIEYTLQNLYEIVPMLRRYTRR